MITPGFGVDFGSHAREARFGIGQGNVSVHVTEEGLVVLYDLLVDGLKFTTANLRSGQYNVFARLEVLNPL